MAKSPAPAVVQAASAACLRRRLVGRIVRPNQSRGQRQDRRGHADAASHESSPFAQFADLQPAIIPDGEGAAPNFPLGGAVRYRDSKAGTRRPPRPGSEDLPCIGRFRSLCRPPSRCRSAVPAFAAPLKSDSVVKATAAAAKPDADGKQTVTLTLAIDKGWHLYANPVG